MQSQSRLPHLPASVNRNKKLDTAASLTRNNSSDPALSIDTTVHIHRAPLAQIDHQLLVTTPATTTITNSTVSVDLASPALSPLAHIPSELIPPPRTVGKSTMPRRSSYTGEDNLYATGGASQGPAYRRLSQYVLFNFHLYIIFSPHFFRFPFTHTQTSNLNNCRGKDKATFRSISDTGLITWLTSWP